MEWPCTAEEIIKERDEKKQSWKQVAVALGLGEGKKNRGRYAQHAYEDLTGLSRHDSKPLGGRGPANGIKRNEAGVAVPKRRMVQWDDDTDQGEVEEALLGVRHVDEKNGSVTWDCVQLRVEHDLYEHQWDEEIACRYATAFTYGPEGDQPLQVSLVDNDGATRTLFVSNIVKVLR